MGGIETTMVRATRWLVSRGHKITLLTFSGDKWSYLLPKEVRCIELGERFKELHYLFHAWRLVRTLKVEHPDVIKGFDMDSSWIACQLGFLFGKGCRVFAGLYNPDLFRPLTFDRWKDERLYLRNYLECIPDNARVFCGLDQIENLEQIHGRKGELWPIPIDSYQYEQSARKPKKGRIVSIGRLAPMKEYNLYMIDVVEKLLRKGYDVSWSVYGVGKYENEMKKRIQERALEHEIQLEGAIPFTKVWRVLEDAYVFVGMGTAVLEAALFRVPNAVAVPYDSKGLSYGPVYNLPPGSVLPSKPHAARTSMINEIERILNLTSSEYLDEAERVHKHVKAYETESSMQRFLQLVDGVSPIKQKPMLYMSNYFRWIMQRFVSSKLFSSTSVFDSATLSR